MVAKGNKDGHRYSYSGGVKAVEESKWGSNKAVERYGALRQPDMRPKDASGPQRLGDSNNLQGPKYHNDTSGCVRAAGEDATTKPNFDSVAKKGFHGKR
jgi:hypothetical protein